MSRFATRLVLVFSAAVLGSGLVGIAESLAENSCDASVQVNESRTDLDGDFKQIQFDASVRVDVDCAQVLYDIVVEELMPNGQTKKVRIPRTVKLNDGSLVETVEHRMPADFEMLEYEGWIVECRPCDM